MQDQLPTLSSSRLLLAPRPPARPTSRPSKSRLTQDEGPPEGLKCAYGLRTSSFRWHSQQKMVEQCVHTILLQPELCQGREKGGVIRYVRDRYARGLCIQKKTPSCLNHWHTFMIFAPHAGQALVELAIMSSEACSATSCSRLAVHWTVSKPGPQHITKGLTKRAAATEHTGPCRTFSPRNSSALPPPVSTNTNKRNGGT